MYLSKVDSLDCNSRRANAFLGIRAQYFLQFYFQRYEYDPSMLDFHLSKLLKILLKIHTQQSTHLTTQVQNQEVIKS